MTFRFENMQNFENQLGNTLKIKDRNECLQALHQKKIGQVNLLWKGIKLKMVILATNDDCKNVLL